MTEENLAEISTQNAEAKETEVNSTSVPHLLKMGFIRNVESNDGLRVEYEVTPAGLQFIADYENVQQELQKQPGGTLPELRFNSTTLTPQQAIAILSSFKLKTLAEQSHMVRVSLLIPARNEAQNIEVLLGKLAAILPSMSQITVVDEGSTDATVQVATALGAPVILQKGTGKGDALRQAFEGDQGGDIVVTMDADGSNRPEEIPQLVAAIVNGADIAKGSRFLKGGGSTDLSYIRRIGNKLFVSIVNHVWSGEYTDLCYGFMAFKKDALNRLNCHNWTSNCLNANCNGCYQLLPQLESKYFQIETEICIKTRKLGLKVVELPSVELKRRHGASKLRGVRDSVRIMKTIIDELFFT